MNNKGLTLVELIVMIFIISIIMILSFSSLTGSLKNIKLKEVEDYKEKVEKAAQLYVETNLDDYPELVAGAHIELDINDLISSGYLKDDIEVEDKCTFEGTKINAWKDRNNIINYEIICDNEN